MTSPYSYTTRYILDKAHFSECFDESVTAPKITFLKKAYTKSLGFVLAGIALLLTGVNGYASWFVVGLGVLEALNVKFKKTWWLWRQMLSKAASGEVTLTIDEQGITSKSYYVDSSILWSDVSAITVTEKGFLIKHPAGTSYVSKGILDADAISFITSKQQIISLDTASDDKADKK